MKELKDTIELMNSRNYRERFIAEYWQLKIRYEKLKKFNTKIEASKLSKINEEINNEPNKKKLIEEPFHDCPISLLKEQQKQMGELLRILELRAELEEIILEED
mgnify:CR=1 FL=1|nr:MAG TPA: hypothetical protein [Caudoviricetes sp.]